jgi:hypothetical protein
VDEKNPRILAYASSKLANEWHSSKNGELTPFDITIGSGKKVWWRCSVNPNHEWEAKVLNRGKGNGCPFCSGKRASIENCLETLNPKLAKDWDEKRNGLLTPKDVTTGSNKKVWWRCQNDDTHSWQATISSRHSGGHQCPVCSGRVASNKNNLELLNPLLSKEWHPERNSGKSPRDFTVNSGQKVWWRCSVDPNHEWEAVIASRNAGHGCPDCGLEKTKKSRLEKNKRKSLAVLHPELLKEWDFEKNSEYSPYELASKSSTKVWWRCSENPSHRWVTALVERSKGSQCPYCIGRFASLETCLATLNPSLAKEWHPTKNGEMTPHDVVPGSGYKVWWLCSNNPEHEWETTVVNRHLRGDGCPICHTRTSFHEQSIVFYLKQVFSDIVNHEMVYVDYDRKELDVYIPSLSLGIEFDGHYYHKNRHVQDIDKNAYMNQQNIQLIRIRERPLQELKDFGCQNYLIEPNDISEMNGALQFILDFISRNYKLDSLLQRKLTLLKDIIDVDKHRSGIYEQYNLTVRNNNLNEKEPLIAQEWHPTKNGKLHPSHVSYASNRKVWWLCDKNHSYLKVVSQRTTGRRGGCPYCAGKKVCLDNCLLTVNPELSKEWHPTENGELTPKDVVPGSQKKVWWRCNRNPKHEWEAVVSGRNSGNGCPYCAGRKIDDSNSLFSKNPEASRLWHPLKNKDLTPHDVAPNSHKRVWCQCDIHPEHEWQILVSNLNKGRGCPTCAKTIRKKRALETKNKKSYEKLKNIAKEKSGEILSEKFLGNRENHEWRCINGHTFTMKPRRVIEQGAWCPDCENIN